MTEFHTGTYWNRLSPSTRNDAMTRGLRAEIQDPLWLIGRQWQLGELRGEDAGSPVKAELWLEHDEVTRVDLAPGDESTPPQAYDVHADGPLESLVEREPVTSDDEPPSRETAAEAGRYFLALLGEEGYQVDPDDEQPRAPTATDFPAELQLQPTDRPVDAAGERFLSVMDGRALDGAVVYDRVTDSGNARAAEDWQAVAWGSVTTPTPTDGSATEAYKRAVKRFVDWYATLYDEPTGDERAWNEDRMEYEFQLATGRGDDETVFAADEYAGGRLDRDDFTVDPDASLQSATDGTDATATSIPSLAGDVGGLDRLTVAGNRPEPDVTVVPTKVSFPGMPSHRWWEFEDGSVNLADIDVGPGEVGKLLLTEHALLYGNDWFSLPVEVDPGTLTRVSNLLVTDTFGVVTTAAPTPTVATDGTASATTETGGESNTSSAEPGTDAREGAFGGALGRSRQWNAFMHTDLPNHDRPGLLVPPVLATHHESDPVERVVVTRDEIANLAFAIELVTEDAIGDPLEWREFDQPTLAVDAVRPASDPADEFVRFENTGESTIDVGDWQVRTDETTAKPQYTFPADSSRTVVDAAETITLYTGRGTGDQSTFYWGRSSNPVWQTSNELTVIDADGDVVCNRFVRRPTDPSLPRYRLVSDLPDNWYPMEARAANGTNSFAIDDLRFRLARLLDADPETPAPRGEILDADVRLHDEELTRAGLAVTRTYQYARWMDGTTHLWAGRRAGVGRGETNSDLRYDLLEDPETGDTVPGE